MWARPVVRPDRELAFASLLGLGTERAGTTRAHDLRAGAAFGILLGLATVLALVGIGAVL